MANDNMAMLLLVGGAALIGATFFLKPGGARADVGDDDGDDIVTIPKDVPVIKPPITTTRGEVRVPTQRPDIDADAEPWIESVQAL
jgi:hypothetical protein